jgi:predicted DCC family thiol-disulfide oxidoreductase YuxK
MTRPVLGFFARVYFVPGLRQIANGLYDWVARNRYRLRGRTDDCEDGACAVHYSERSAPK